MSIPLPARPAVHYPDSDGQPMADNTLQFDWIAILKWNAEAYFRDDPQVFVAGDHLIYPVEGDPGVRQAPDAYVAFGRPKGYRGSYKVFEEANIFPQVIFEVWSPNNRQEAMNAKRDFYERFGAQEYYIVYPEFPAHVDGWQAENGSFVRIPQMNGFVSPRLGWRFQITRGELAVYGPDGKILRRPDEIAAERDELATERDELKEQRNSAVQRAAEAHQKAEQERARAEHEQQRAEKLAARLKALGVDPDSL